MAGFYAARDNTMPPLPWPSIAPPFTLWRSLKYEAVYLRELADGFEAERVIDEWMAFYNAERPHSALAGGSLSRRGASEYDGQAASRLDHISTGATAAGRLKEMRILAA